MWRAIKDKKYSEEFRQIIVPLLKEKFKNYISEYNSIIQNKITDKIDESLKFVKSKTDINNYDFKRFETDTRLELSEIQTALTVSDFWTAQNEQWIKNHRIPIILKSRGISGHHQEQYNTGATTNSIVVPNCAK